LNLNDTIAFAFAKMKYEFKSDFGTILWFSYLHVVPTEEINHMENLGFCISYINLLKPTGYVMHHQFNIQQL